MNSDRSPAEDSSTELDLDALADEALRTGIEERLRVPLNELVDKVASLADAILPVEHKRVAEDALRVGRELLGKMDELVDVEPSEPPAPRPAEEELVLRRVLVVDADRVEQRVIAGYMQVDGFECQEATEAKQAIELLTEQRFDVLILDIDLEGVGPKAVLDALKQEEPASLAARPAVLLLGNDEADLRRLRVELGASAFVTRPFCMGALGDAIRPCLR